MQTEIPETAEAAATATQEPVSWLQTSSVWDSGHGPWATLGLGRKELTLRSFFSVGFEVMSHSDTEGTFYYEKVSLTHSGSSGG